MMGINSSPPVQEIIPEFDFAPHIAKLTEDFVGREWVFEEINRWFADPNGSAILILTGEPGVGKSAIAARLTQVSRLAAHHFCIARDSRTLDPVLFSKSLSQQLCGIDDFALSILKKTKNIEVNISLDIQANYGRIIPVLIKKLVVEARSGSEAFTHAVLEPLAGVDAFNQQAVILVDALDEAQQYAGAETILDLLANTGPLPHQVRFILTCRPDGRVLSHFEHRQILHISIDAARPENMADVHRYVRAQLDASKALRTRVRDKNLSDELFAERITTASEGNFLYAVYLLPAIAAGIQSFDTLDMLPAGLDNIYRAFLTTRKLLKNKWISCRPVLGVLAAARQPLTEEQLAKFSGLTAQAVNDILVIIEPFLEPTLWRQGLYQFYHQSMIDFLRDKNRSGNKLWIDLVSMHQNIVNCYYKTSDASPGLDWSRMDEYGLRYLVAHQTVIVEAKPGKEQPVRQLINLATNSRFVRARIGVLGPTAVELETSTLRRFYPRFWENIRLGLTEIGLMFGILSPRPVTQNLPEQLSEEKETVLFRQTLTIRASPERVFRYAQALSEGRLHERILPDATIPDVLEEEHYIERNYTAYFFSPSSDLPPTVVSPSAHNFHGLSKIFYRLWTGIKLPIWDTDPKVGTLKLKVTLTSNALNETQVTQETSLIPSTFLVEENKQDPKLLNNPLAPLQLSYFLLNLKSLAEAPSHIGANLLSDRLNQPTTLQRTARLLLFFAMIAIGTKWGLVGAMLALAPIWLSVESGSEARKAAMLEKETGVYMPRARGWRTLFWFSLVLLAIEVVVLL